MAADRRVVTRLGLLLMPLLCAAAITVFALRRGAGGEVSAADTANAPQPDGPAESRIGATRASARATVAEADAPLPAPATSGATSAAAEPRASTSPAAPAAPERIFVFGDSMVINLMQRFADYALENAHELHAAIWYGSTTYAWSSTGKLAAKLAEHDPTLVVAVLGSSEITSCRTDACARGVRKVLEIVGSRRLVWVGPLHFREDAGFNAMLERELGKGRFFRSSALDLKTVGDGVHPSPTAGGEWVDALAAWIRDASDSPIALRSPTAKAPKPKPFIYPAPY